MKKFGWLMILTALFVMLGSIGVVYAEVIPPYGPGQQIGYPAVVLCEKLTLREKPSASSKALQSLDRFQGKSNLKSWLCAIAKNQWLSEQRKKNVQPVDEVTSLADPSVGPEERIIRQDESMHIHRLLHHLDEPYREVFTLRTLGQLSFRDIGELFDKSENWACVVYHRARARLKEKMEG